MSAASFIRKDHSMSDGTMSAYHFGDISAPIHLILLHATGFNGRVYRTVLEDLGGHVVSLDLRGHGLSNLPADPKSLPNYHAFRDDVLEFISRYAVDKVVLAGHSMGASVGLLCAPHLKGKLKGYVGFDSPLLPPWMYPLTLIPGFTERLKTSLPIAAAAGRRRSIFDSFEDVFQRYRHKAIFEGFKDDVLQDYINGGFIEREGQLHLACEPKWEQAVFAAQRHNLYKAARSLPKNNTQVIFASIQAPSSPLARERMRGIVGARNVQRLKGLNHMFPLNRPEVARAALIQALNPAI